MARSNKISPYGGLFLAGFVAMLTVGVVSRAMSAALVPDVAVFPYSLASGASSAAIIPPANVATLVMGCQTTRNNVGSSDMTVVNSVGQDGELVWSGLESNGGGVTTGYSTTPGKHIMFIDWDHSVDLEVNNATSFVVHNANSGSQTGQVKVIW